VLAGSMMTPMEDTEFGSRRGLVDGGRSNSGWWARRTGLERALLVGLAVLGCAAVAAVPSLARTGKAPQQEAPAAAPQQEVCLTPECAVAAAGIIQAMDVTADPCEDFFRFSCGGWMDGNTIPEGKSKWGRFYELRNEVDEALKEIVTGTEAAPASVGNLRTMFSACMDTETIETAGLHNILAEWFGPEAGDGGWPMVQGNSWAGEKFALAKVVGIGRRNLNSNWLLSTWVYLDDFNTDHNVIYLDQPDLGLPQSMYLDQESYADYIAAYKAFMFGTAKVMARELGSGVEDSFLLESVDSVFELEAGIAKQMTPDSERRNSTAMYNPMLVSDLKINFPDFDWTAYFDTVFRDTNVTVGDDERVIVVQPDYFAGNKSFSTMIAEKDDRTVADYVYWLSMKKLAGDLTEEMRDLAFQYQAALTGVSSAPPRWQTCLSKSVGAWGFAAAHEYVLTNFDESAKAQADAMVEGLRAAFKELVEETDWMDGETQVSAKEKADQMLQLIGYPDWLLDPAAVDALYAAAEPANPADHMGNVISMLGWSSRSDLVTLRESPHRDVWLMHPAIVNAWYSPNHNTITFPAGILQPPFFKGGWPRYLNYGAIGMVIGHEITHGFDDQGRQYDGSGSVAPWWSDSTIQAFSKQAQCFIDQYSNYSLPELFPILGEEDSHLNGRNTQGENIADNGGIHETFRAYSRSVEAEGEEPALPGLTQFSPQQMLFISYAQVWCEIQTPESLLGQVLGDVHSPGKFRVIGPLGNSEDFQREFSCPADSPMNREEKCKLW